MRIVVERRKEGAAGEFLNTEFSLVQIQLHEQHLLPRRTRKYNITSEGVALPWSRKFKIKCFYFLDALQDFFATLVHVAPCAAHHASITAIQRQRHDSCFPCGASLAIRLALYFRAFSATFPLAIIFLAAFVEPDDELAHVVFCCWVDRARSVWSCKNFGDEEGKKFVAGGRLSFMRRWQIDHFV
jgi:hypothetical protein